MENEYGFQKCEDCREEFWGHRNCKRCTKCAHKKRIEQARIWAQKNKKRKNEYKKAYYKEHLKSPRGEKIEEDRIKFREDLEKRLYCAVYDSSRIDCISCYENQVAKYKACRK